MPAVLNAMDVVRAREMTTLEEQTSTFVVGDMVYVMFCAFGVFLITPAISLFYSGFLRRKNVVQLLFQSYMTTAIITIVWYLFGYSIACSPTSTSVFIGNLDNAALHAEEAKPLFEGGTIPSVVNFCFNVFFPVATAQIFLASIGERGRFLPSQVVGVLFTVFVYSFQAYWVWGANGWLLNLGALDFAGGGPVHISSGIASICYSWYLGPREQPGKRVGKILHNRGHSMTTTFIGVTLIWAAWFCFNSGTLLSVNVRTGYIFLNTLLASCFACVTFVFTDFFMTGKYSMKSALIGVVLGLVAITGSCGYVKPWGAAVIAIITAFLCRFLMGFNKWTGIDDYSESGVVHAFAGIIADTLTGIFASKTIAGYDGITEIDGGWIDGNFVQIGYQIASWLAVVAWTGVVTMIILFVVDHIPGLKLRASVEAEEMGMDLYEMEETLDEFGNNYDEFFVKYAAKLREIADSIEAKNNSNTLEVLDGQSESVQSESFRYEGKK